MTSAGSKTDPRKRPPRRALVLGARGAADAVAEPLVAEGFEVLFEEEGGKRRLLPPSDPLAVQRLRELLSEFAQGAQASGVDLVHPGVSPWAARPELSLVGQELGLSVVLPPLRVITLFSNKINLFSEAEKLGIPNLLVSPDPMHSIRELEKLIELRDLRFPVVLKAVKGGGSHGLFVLRTQEDLEQQIPLWFEQLRGNLGEVIFLAEKWLEGARQITVPFARFPDGSAETFEMMDSSLQSRRKKVIEFCPPVALEPDMAEQLREWTLKFAGSCGFIGVGSLEFLVDGTRAFLVEGLARLNTGFALWEAVSGVSAVGIQLAILQGANGIPLSKGSARYGSGVMMRIQAEDSVLQLPQPGMVREVSEKRQWDFPGAKGKLYLSVGAGQELAYNGHGMLGFVVVRAKDHKQATNLARGILNEIWIAGSVQTNERFLSELVFHPWVREGIFHAGFVDEEFVPMLRPEVRVLQTFPWLAEQARALAGQESNPEARWIVGDQRIPFPQVELDFVQPPEAFQSKDGPGLSGTVQLGELSARFLAFPTEADKWKIRVGNWVFLVKRVTEALKGKRRKMLALVSGRVASLRFREGSLVRPHEYLALIESLGTWVPHALPTQVRLVAWKVAAGEVVQAGQELAEFELL